MEQFLSTVLSQYWQPALGLLVGYGLNYVFQNKLATPEQVAPYEDYLALLIDLGVHVAEKSGLPGADKLELAKETIFLQLEQSGFNGRSTDIDSERVVSDIEAAVSKYFPKSQL